MCMVNISVWKSNAYIPHVSSTQRHKMFTAISQSTLIISIMLCILLACLFIHEEDIPKKCVRAPVCKEIGVWLMLKKGAISMCYLLFIIRDMCLSQNNKFELLLIFFLFWALWPGAHGVHKCHPSLPNTHTYTCTLTQTTRTSTH